MFPFRYKLTLTIISLIVSLLAGSFVLLQQVLQSRFTDRIHNDLDITRNIVHELMLQRHQSLARFAKALENDLLIRELLTDSSLDEFTRQDILNEEILPSFPTLDVLITTDTQGKFNAFNNEITPLLTTLAKRPELKAVNQGNPVTLHLFQADKCIQLIAKPVFINQEMVGSLFVGQYLTPSVAEKIKSLSGADLAFFNAERIFLSTEWQENTATHQQTESQLTQVFKQQNTDKGELALQKEQHIFQKVTASSFLPSYIVAKSLDKQLAFVNEIRDLMIWVSAFGLIIGSTIAFIFAASISRPIRLLKQATEEIEREHFHHRVEINTKDEFKQLARSFNKMTQGLEERETLHTAMNQVVSQEITSALLAGKLNTEGQNKNITMLLAGIHDFGDWSSQLDPAIMLRQLNNYHTRLSFAIDSHKGVIDKYLGEVLVAIFGSPITHPIHAVDALTSASTLLSAHQQFNQESNTSSAISLSICIHTGLVTMGYIGAENRNNYSIAGKEFSKIQRYFLLCKAYQAAVIFTDATRDEFINSQSEIELPPYRQLECVNTHRHDKDATLYQLLDATDPLSSTASIKKFKQARLLFLGNQFEQSNTLFNELLNLSPEDKVVMNMIKRNDYCQQHPAWFEENFRHQVFQCKQTVAGLV
jgi:adenylate cyclase